MRPRRSAVIAAIATLAGVGFPVAAHASTTAASSSSGWQRYYAQPIHDDAGSVCAFAVQGDVVYDKEYYRTLSSYPDGSPKLQEFRGPLYFRYTNESTGKSVVRNLTGRAWFEYRPDGGLVVPWVGHGGITVHVGNQGYPAGEWVLNGGFTLIVKADHNRTIDQYWGTRENLCHTLA